MKNYKLVATGVLGLVIMIAILGALTLSMYAIPVPNIVEAVAYTAAGALASLLSNS